MNKMDEKILVVDRNSLFEQEQLAFQGVMTDERIVQHIMSQCDRYQEIRRGDAEENDYWKQPIPYVVIKRGEEVFLYKRLKAGGEARLHDQLSIGVGGHMNMMPGINEWGNLLLVNMQKELNEELDMSLALAPTLTIRGLINNDSDEVGAVHIGILITLTISEESDVSVRETDKLEGSWVRVQDLNKSPLFESLEAWSKMAVEVL